MASMDYSYLKPHSCDECRKLVLDFRTWNLKVNEVSRSPGRAEDGKWQGQRADPTNQRRSNVFDFTVANLRQAADKGCPLSAMLIMRLGDYDEDALVTESSKIAVLGVVGVMVVFVVDVGDKEPRHLSGWYQIVATQDNVAGRCISTRPINIQPGSNDSLQLAQQWLRTCRTHTNCWTHRTKYMPSKILEISHLDGQRTIKLRDCDRETPEDYAALSYCWGEKGSRQVFETTKATLKRHMTGIDLTDLPPSLRDAVQVTESLGLRFLWVDALCIVQDDPVDKASEIGQMSFLYSQAAVTIVASRARGVEEGFLHRRCVELGLKWYAFELPYIGTSGESGSVMLIPEIEEDLQPLELRGWALQEHLLSPRILEFGSLQTRWTCEENRLRPNMASTDGWRVSREQVTYYQAESATPFHLRISQDEIAQWDYSNDNQTLQADAGVPTLEQWCNWYELVHHYTGRQLSFPADRLPAIAGIAETYGHVFRDDYLAGLWKSDLVHGLLWQLTREISGPGLFPRPSTYSGPSWSWAAITRPVDRPLYAEEKTVRNKVDSDLEIIDCEVQPLVKEKSPGKPYYGAVRSGRLVLKGRMRQAQWIRKGTYMDLNSYQPRGIRRFDIEGESGVLPAAIYPDALEKDRDGEDAEFTLVWLLRISSSTQGPQGLVLRHLEGSNYSRLGLFKFNGFHLQPQEEVPEGGYKDDESGGDVKEKEDPWRRAQRESPRYQSQLRWLDEGDLQTVTIT